MSDRPPYDPRNVPRPGAQPPVQRPGAPVQLPPDLTAYRPSAERPPHYGGPPQGHAGGFDPRFGAPPPPQQQAARQPARGSTGAPPRGGRPPRRRRRWLRALAWTIGGIGVLAGAAITALVVFAPVGMIRDQVVREVKARTGRDLKIAGRTGLTFYPSLGVTMSDVTLSAPPQMGGAPFIQMRRLEAAVPVLPLLRRQVSVDRLVLTEPVIDLRVDKGGRRSWDFAGYLPPPAVMVAQAKGSGLPAELEDFVRNSSGGGVGASSPAREPAPGRSAGARAQLQDIALGDVRIDNGTVRYRDERTGSSEEVRSINARLSGQSLTSPVEAKGSFTLRGEQIDFDGRLSTPRALMEERPARVALAISAPRATARYTGSLSIAKGGQIEGALKLNVPSLRELASWAGVPPSAAPGIGAVALEADVKNGATWIAFDNAKLAVDRITATGSATIDAVPGARPSVKANLRFGAVDLNPYLAASGSGPEAAPPQPPQSQPRPAAGKAPATPQVRGFNQRSGWSEEPLNVIFLGALDADLRISMASVLYREIKVGATQLAIALKNRQLRSNVEDMRLYGGQARGIVTLDGTQAAPVLGVNLTADGVTALPLLKDAAGFDWIDGRGKLQIAVAGQGGTQKAIVESLAGKADFTFTDGALVGFNIPQMIRGLSQGKIGNFSRVPTERTDFTEAGASFQIKGGVAETKDVRAASPLLRLTGAGTIGLGQRQVDIVLRPKLVGTLTGQAGSAAGDLSGLELPVKIRGPWERPQVAPDLDGVLRNPNQAVEAVRQLGRQIQQGNPGGVNQLIDQFRRR